MIAKIHQNLKFSGIKQLALLPGQPGIGASNKTRLAQYFTSPQIARFMCGLFNAAHAPVHLLDPGAGEGVLSAAFMERFKATPRISSVGRDLKLIPALKTTHSLMPVIHDVYFDDFISLAKRWLIAGKRPFSHIVMNPPYKKISSSSNARLILRSVGVETVNLYSAFVSLALLLLEPGGELVAIIPRSFCNGPYFRSFRRLMTEKAAICSLHLFRSRKSLFSTDKVLQENIILHLERDGEQKNVRVSSSTDDSSNDMEVAFHAISAIVEPKSEEAFLRIPAPNYSPCSPASGIGTSPLEMDVSTGPVVDFRAKEYLNKNPSANDVPLLYPGHFHKGLFWPRDNFKRSNSIILCARTRKWLFPKGWYVLTRRFSSNEERRRIVAYIVDPDMFPGYEWLAFENHLNVFHKNRKSLSENIARGLAAYLNSAEIDKLFREIRGHTQVNATDLRNLKYPTSAQLELIGENSHNMQQEEINAWLKILLLN